MLENRRVFFEEKAYVCLWDGFAVAEGHALVVPRRHIETWFDATLDEQSSLLAGIEKARSIIDDTFHPDGYNIGINVGEAGGQTVDHLHIHIIPRYRGDVHDPRGGVRHVIPGKGNYLVNDRELKDGKPLYAERQVAAAISGSPEYPLLDALAADLGHASSIDLAVAFVFESGLLQLQPYFDELLERGGRVRLLTGDYMDATQPRALHRLYDLVSEYGESAQIKVFETTGKLGFHPKAYLLNQDYDGVVAYVGSSNLSKHALTVGLEWNQRITGHRSESSITQIQSEFDRLFGHELSKPLTPEWITAYEARRKPVSFTSTSVPVDRDDEIPPETPEPHPIQVEALAELAASRKDGNQAGLVVMATGLGKTWLAAFDSEKFKRVLFVAHREEILKQAMNTFRKIRPEATLGMYHGGTYQGDAEVVFASIQTLGRAAHLRHFDPERFDYIVIDEFHHASATTYRRLIEHFDPTFLLGLTATPERTDGGDLLALCGENLVFRCDLVDGINQSLLSPFQYFGVPDEVDFTNIPWRSGRFDPEKLEFEVATEKRAKNALDQWRKRSQTRTLAFCVSKRHADFMANYFVANEVRAVSVHSGPSAAPRTQSLQQLEAGELDVVFAVDMFNEGLDVPTIDTVMMLRPTESKILWLQQFGRGLRRADSKSHLSVIDYIGNHKSFLQVPSLLLPGCGSSPGQIRQALKKLEQGELVLPLGCSVEYELGAIDILKQLTEPSRIADQVRFWYQSFRELHGRRPTASEAYHEGYSPKSIRNSYGSWFAFVNTNDDLSDAEIRALSAHGEFLQSLEVTPMTKSFKMVSLLAMMAADSFPGKITIEDLCRHATHIAARVRPLRDEFGAAIDDVGQMKALLESNPIAAWTGGKGTGGVPYFSYDDEAFVSFPVEPDSRDSLAEMTRELCEWRLSSYLDRKHGETGEARSIVCNVSHSGSAPILFLPDREKNPGIPMGWTTIVYKGEEIDAKFVKIAVNLARRDGDDANVLPDILRDMFGPDAGASGTSQNAKFELENGIYHLKAVGEVESGPIIWNEYMRADIPPLWGLKFNTGSWNQGFVTSDDHLFLLVSLSKDGMAKEHQYKDHFLSRNQFEWKSQNSTSRDSAVGRRISEHAKTGAKVHLLVRDQRKTPAGKAAPFVYCGEVTFVDWEGDKPITVRWKLENALSDGLAERFGL